MSDDMHEEPRMPEKPKRPTPVALEAKKGHRLLDLGNDVYVEVSRFRGKTYVAIREWWLSDEDGWLRKKGLSLKADVMTEVLAQMEKVQKFVVDELKDPYESE